jgi:predicted permease
VRLNSKPTDLNEDKYALYKQNFSDSHTQNVKAKNLVLKGHPYYHCSRHLFSKGVGYLRPYIPEDLDVNATLQDRWIMRCMKSKVVYLIQNQTRRPFASGNALLNIGFQFTDIREIDHHHSRCQKEFLWMPVGQPITWAVLSAFLFCFVFIQTPKIIRFWRQSNHPPSNHTSNVILANWVAKMPLKVHVEDKKKAKDFFCDSLSCFYISSIYHKG